jgi:hypothetical protein
MVLTAGCAAPRIEALIDPVDTLTQNRDPPDADVIR